MTQTPIPYTPSKVRGLALSSARRKVGLYGGSFNPVHGGHKHVALSALQKLDLDEVWVLVSPGNPLKAENSDMAPLQIRCEKTTAFLQHPRIKVMIIEEELNTRYSADTIKKLKQNMPLVDFTWIMGADNAHIFHHWGRWREIVSSLPIAIFARTGYSKGKRNYRVMSEFKRFETSPKKLVKSHPPALCFVDVVRHPASATLIRSQKDSDWWDQ